MIPKHLLATVAGISTAGGVATGSYYLFKNNKIEPPKSLRQILKSEEFEELNTENDENDAQWKELIKKHLDNNFTKVNKISGINIVAQEGDISKPENLVVIKTKCREILAKTSDFDNDKEIAKNWCNKKSKVLDANNVGG